MVDNANHRFLITRQTVSDEEKKLLESTAWTSNYLTDDGKTPMATPSRLPMIGDAGSFFYQTLNSKTTIMACRSFYVFPSEPRADEETRDMVEFHTIYSLGTGLNGHDKIAHGGFLALMLDESMSIPAHLYTGFTTPMTKSMHVDYKRPLPLPGLILCRAWCTKVEGRKMWVSATIEDGQGREYAVGKSLFIESRGRL